MSKGFCGIRVDADSNKHTVYRLIILQYGIGDMTPYRLTLHCFLTRRGGHCDFGQNSEIFKFVIQITLTATSSRNRQKVGIQFESTNFIRLVDRVIDC